MRLKRRASNLVLGYATNLPPESIEWLASTLRDAYSPRECDLVLFTNHVDDKLSSIAEEQGVTFLHTPNVYSSKVSKFSKLINRCIIYPTKYAARLSKPIPALDVIFGKLYPTLLILWHHPHFVRWLTYRNFLAVNPHYRNILITDVKDVAFQCPFFEELGDYDLHFFKQDVFYGPDDYWDSRWYTKSYGARAFQKIIGHPAICIGTVLGSMKGIQSFLGLFCERILRGPFVGIEQSIFNHMLHMGEFSCISMKIHENADGAVLTLTENSLHRFEVCPDGLYTVAGKLIPVVHMYDRNEEAFRYFSTKFSTHQ
jgi:hypothetical protein